MRPVIVVLSILLASALTSSARAQSPSRPILYNTFGPYSVYGPDLGFKLPPSTSSSSGSAHTSSAVPASTRPSSATSNYVPISRPRYVRITVGPGGIRPIVIPEP